MTLDFVDHVTTAFAFDLLVPSSASGRVFVSVKIFGYLEPVSFVGLLSFYQQLIFEPCPSLISTFLLGLR